LASSVIHIVVLPSSSKSGNAYVKVELFGEPFIPTIEEEDDSAQKQKINIAVGVVIPLFVGIFGGGGFFFYRYLKKKK
jgi:hypothetical protein